MCPRKSILGENSPFWAKHPYYIGREENFWYPHIRKSLRHLVLVGHGIKWIREANIWPKMAKESYFGPSLSVFGPKIIIFTRLSKRFGTHITENHLRTSFALFFGRAWDKMGQKCQFLAKNAYHYYTLVLYP